MKLYEVAVAAPIFGTLTYSQPTESIDPLPSGIRVLVPLGGRLITGYLLAPSDIDTTNLSYKIKAIVDRLDPDPLFPEQLIPFFRWIAQYYHYPVGEVIRTALPSGLHVRSGREVVLTDSGKLYLPDVLVTMKEQVAWGERLLAKGKLAPGTVKTIWRKAAMQRLLKTWQGKGWINLQEVIVEPKVKRKTSTMVVLNAELREQVVRYQADSLEASSFGQHLKKSEQKTLELFSRHSKGRRTLPRAELTRRYSGAGKALHSLADAGLVTLEEQRVYRDPFGDMPPFFSKPETLTQEQGEVVSRINAALDADNFQSFLLHGVTGSGKTEVYLQATEYCLALQKKVLILVPEIALSSQLEAHFYSRFGNTLAVLHSGIAPGERFDQWRRILQNKVSIVIGARSAVFAPYADLGLVIVDEEHEPAYKQDDGLRYNGRDMAVLRAKFANCPVLLGSATPSVVSFYHAQKGKYHLLTMRKRIHDQPLPEVEIIDLGKRKRSRPDLFFSDELITALHANMDRRLQSLLFVNRRGYASFMLCRDCGYIVQCRHCKVSLTHHRRGNRLLCHYCGYSTRPDIICPDCQSGSLVGLGVGSERIEAEVRQLIPHARVARLDSDTARNRKSYLSVLQQIRNHEVDILIGTQMVAKGLHFPKMTLVGIVWADSGLGLPDYKAAERSFQLLAQVTGRAGRGKHAGKVLIQTHQPQHYVIEYARSHAYRKMYEQEIELRRGLFYPPFGRLINIRFSGEDEEQVAKRAKTTAAFLHDFGERGVDILGPVPAPLSMIKKRFRWQLLLKSRSPERLHWLCERLLEEKKRFRGGSVRVGLDVDPENMM
ncbi:MAG: primosomal protein N' [Candidatus Electrothrix sp. AR4]|nr:primosomal protein N' [Candidatus Electrothrix sp. AR4]